MSSYWNEQMKKSVEKRATKQSSGGSSSGSSGGYSSKTKNYWENMLGTGSALNVDGVNQWFTDVAGVSEEMRNYAETQGDRFTRNYGGKAAARVKELLAAADDVQTFIDNHRDELSDHAGAQSFLDEMRKELRAYDTKAYRRNNFFSQWDTEDAYNKAMQQSNWAKKYQGKGYQELVPLLEGLEDGEEKQWLTDYAGAVDYDERVNMDLDAANQEIQALQDQLNRARNLEENYNEYRNSPLLMLTQGDTWRDLESRYDAFTEKYGSIEKLQADIEKKRLRMAEGKQTQDSIRAEAELEEWKKTVRNADTVQKELDRLNEVIALNEKSIQKLNQGSSQQDLLQRQQADAQKQTLEQQRTALERELQYSKMRDYMALMDRPDFAKNSQYIPTGSGGVLRDAVHGRYAGTDFQDLEYEYINKNEQARHYQGSIDSMGNLQRMGLDRSWLLQMTDEEVAIYNYLHRTKGKEETGKYLDTMRSILRQRQRAATETEWAEAAKEHPYLTSGFSVALAPVKAVGFIGQVIDRAADGRIDQNAAYNRASHISNAIRNQVTHEIQQNEKWGAVGAFGYQTAMSMGDFLINGAAGGAFWGVPGVATAIMGSGAAADTVIQAKDRGLDDNASFGLGIVAGLAEALTERVSLEALLDPDILKNGIGVYVLKNSLTEGSEEVASSVINLAADIIASKEKSEWQQAIRSYQDMGYSEEEAFAKAMADQAASLGMDFLGGALSGGIMSGANSAQYYADTKRTGRGLERRGLTDADQIRQILDAGTRAEAGTDARAVADRLRKKTDAGGKLSAFDKGQLYQADPDTVREATAGSGSVQLAHNLVRGIDQNHEDWKTAVRLANMTGRDIRFYNGAPREDGYYKPETGAIYVNVDRGSKHKIAYVFTHELTHSTEAGGNYDALLEYVRGKIRSEGRDWNTMIQKKKEYYASEGHPLSTDLDAEKELVAEEIQQRILTNEQELRTLFWNEPTLGEKFVNWCDRMLAKCEGEKDARERVYIQQTRQRMLKAWIDANRVRREYRQPQTQNEAAGQSQEQMTAPREDTGRTVDDYWNDMEQMEDDALEDWLDIRDHESALAEGEAELGRQYSLAMLDAEYADKQNYIDSDVSSEEAEAGIQEVSTMAPVAQITGNEFAKGEVDLITQVERFFAQENNEVYNPQIGTVILDRKGVKSDIAHGIGRKKAAAFAAVPDVIEKGRVVDYQKNWKQRGYDTAVIAAPIQIGEEEHIAAVIAIRSRNTNLFYLHEVMTTKNGAMPFKTGARKSGLPSGDAPSIFSILDRIVEVKNNTDHSSTEKQFSLSGTASAGALNKRDVARDLRAILSRGGDPRELQRYVDSLERSRHETEQTRENRYQTGENRNSTAREILQAAHSQRQSVEEYLRWNPEQFEVDGRWRSEALEAIRMERGRRQYSLSEDYGNIPEEEPNSQPRVIQRENLDQQGKQMLRGIENRLIHAIGRAMDVPQNTRYRGLHEVVTEMADEYLAKGTISEDKISELFDKAYANGVRDSKEYFDKYKDIQKTIKTTAVTLTEEDRKLIPEKFSKTVWYNTRLVDSGGLTVEALYADLQARAPELFPEYHDSAIEKLVRIAKVGEDIHKGELTLKEHYGEDRENYRKWKMNDFRSAMEYMMRDLRDLKRYAEDKESVDKEETGRILTPEDAEKEMAKLSQLRKAVDRAERRNALTTSDHIQIGRLLKGEIQPEHLDEGKNNVKGILAVYTAKLAYEEQQEVIRAYKSSIRAERNAEADELLKTANEWEDKKSGFQYARETMLRNIRDIVKDRMLADKINRTYFEPVQIKEAERTRFLNDYRGRVKALEISRRANRGDQVSEAYAVQFLGEALDHIRVLEKMRGSMEKRGGKTLDEWRAEVMELWKNSPSLDRAKVENAVKEFQQIYDEILPMMNNVLVANGYEPVPYRRGYFPHFQEGGTGLLAYFGKMVGMDTRADMLPTTINGLTHTFRPGKQWFSHGLERSGDETTYDALQGFDIYIEGASGVIFHTENIQKLRAFEDRIRYRTSDKGIQEQVDAILRSDLPEDQKRVQIDAIHEHGKSSLSNFAVELREYTNLLANKKSSYDRGMERFFDRRIYTTMKTWENQIGANMIAMNFSSAMTNWIPLTSAAAQLNKRCFCQAVWDTAARKRREDGFIDRSDFLTNRRGSQRVSMSVLQQASQKAGFLMEWIDNTTSEIIVRSAYLHNLNTGLSEAEAMHQADLFAAGIMADRSKGAMPTLFEAKNPLFKAFTQFQLEVNNQFSEIGKDIPRRYLPEGFSLRNWKGLKRDELGKYAWVMFQYWLLSYLFNDVYEKLMGRRPALDPVDMLVQTVGDVTGYEMPNILDMAWDLATGEEISFETEKVGFGEAVSNLAGDMVSQLPFSAGLNLVGIETDGGRLPAASAIPDFSAIWQASTNGDLTGDQRWKMLQDELNKLAYVLPPFGGGQISKSYKGIKAYLEGGSYSLDKDGDEILQYPVYKDDPDDAFWSLVRAAFLGKNSLPEAQDWVKSGYDSLNQYETVVYQDLLNCGVKDRDAFALVDQLRKLEETETEAGARRAQGRRILAKSDISAEGKAAAFYGMVATETEREWMDELVDVGADQADTMAFVSNLYDAKSMKGMEKKQEQLSVFLDAPLTEEEKKVAIGFIMDTDLETESGNPTQYAKFLSALETGLTVDKYMEIRATETDIEDYLELTDIGIKGEKAADLAMSIDALEPTEGYDKVHWTQKAREIIESNLIEPEQMAAIEAVSGIYESTYEKIKIGRSFGMNLKSYIDLKSIMNQFNTDGNNSYSEQETENAINALSGDDNPLFALTGTTPNGYTLSDREKAILWQLQDKRFKPKDNPFDREVGQMVYDIMHEETTQDATETAESGAVFDIANLFSKLR